MKSNICSMCLCKQTTLFHCFLRIACAEWRTVQIICTLPSREQVDVMNIYKADNHTLLNNYALLHCRYFPFFLSKGR